MVPLFLLEVGVVFELMSVAMAAELSPEAWFPGVFLSFRDGFSGSVAGGGAISVADIVEPVAGCQIWESAHRQSRTISYAFRCGCSGETDKSHSPPPPPPSIRDLTFFVRLMNT